ncbi:MAG: hypothetical protein M1831_001439 [Alyxoria varia]|nr:MAG: hypothetical protein M1831_001439 [Alyxoria varia]
MAKTVQPSRWWCISASPTYAFEQSAPFNTLRPNIVARTQIRQSSKSTRQLRAYSSSAQERVTISGPLNPNEIHEILSRPTWSVKSLLPHSSTGAESQGGKSPSIDARSTTESSPPTASTTEPSEITTKTLQHLHKLSALTPPPRDSSAERRLLKDLRAQLHFVQEIRSRDLRNVEPMGAVRDEIEEEARTVGLESEGVRRELERESKRQGSTKRSESAEEASDRAAAPPKTEEWKEKWDVLGQAPKRVGRFFAVEGGNGTGQRRDGSLDP